jgi:hypothetical protein
MKNIIYGLRDNKNNIFRYIGKTNDLKIRLKSHILESKRLKKTRKHHWINKVINDGGIIEIVEIEVVDRNDKWEDREKFWINKYSGNDLTNHANGGYGGSNKRYIKSYLETKEWCANNLPNIKTQNNWNKIKNELPNFIPKKPDLVYKYTGWISWSDFLNSDNISNKLKRFIQYKEAKKWLKTNLNIKSQNEWNKSIDYIPDFIPKSPEHVYKNTGWISWGDFLSSVNISPKLLHENLLTLAQLKNIVNENNIKSKNEWVNFVNSLNNKQITTKPDRVYKNIGWKSWFDFLNKDKPTFLTFEESKTIVHNLKLKSNKQWRIFIKNNKLKEIPTNPDKYYKNVWISWYDWLGLSISS